MSTPIPASDWLDAARDGKTGSLAAWKREGRLDAVAMKRLVGICDTGKSNALLLAIEHGQEDYALALVDLGRWPDSTNREHNSALALAVGANMPELVQKLIDMGHRTGNRPGREKTLLDIACLSGSGMAGQVLLANGVQDVSYNALCDLVVKATNRSTVLQDGQRIYPGEEIKLLDGLLRAGVDPNATGDAVINRSCLQQWCGVVETPEDANPYQIEILHLLLKHGANTEQKVLSGARGLIVLPGFSWMGWDNGMQDFLREQKALVSQKDMDQAVGHAQSTSAGPARRI